MIYYNIQIIMLKFVPKEKPTLKDVYDQIGVIINIAATKDDLKVLKTELKLEIGKVRDEAFVHADRKSVEVIAEIGKRINHHGERDKKFKTGLIDVMKNNSLASGPELEQLGVLI